jgi:esterase/lipase superfamily enzyme
MLSLSGLFQLGLFIGDYMDETVYLNTPLVHLAGLDDPSYLLGTTAAARSALTPPTSARRTTGRGGS